MAGLFGTLVGLVGTGAGGFLACFMPAENKRIISLMLGFSAGIMLAIVSFDLLPNAFEYAPLPAVLFGVVVGVALMAFSDNLINTDARRAHTKNSIKTTGLVIALGMAIHNFLEGLAVGSGFEAEQALGISLTIAIVLHDVPEGMSVAIPLRAGGMSRIKALALASASGLSTGLGTMFGTYVGQIAVTYIALCLAVAGGAMLYIVFENLLPESSRMVEGKSTSIDIIIGMLTGIIVSVKMA